MTVAPDYSTVYRSESSVVGLDLIKIRIADSKIYFNGRFWFLILIPPSDVAYMKGVALQAIRGFRMLFV
jgi:hypothetical protein